MTDPLDLPALRAVIAGVRERLAKATPGRWVVRYLGPPSAGSPCFVQAPRLNPEHPYDIEVLGEDDTLYPTRRADAELIASAPSDLTTLASACERLAEENERLRGERVVLAMLAADGPAFSSPLHAAMAKALRDRVLAEATPAPAGKGEG